MKLSTHSVLGSVKRVALPEHDIRTLRGIKLTNCCHAIYWNIC